MIDCITIMCIYIVVVDLKPNKSETIHKLWSVCAHKNKYTCTHTNTHALTTYTHTCTHTCTHTHTSSQTLMHTHARIQKHIIRKPTLKNMSKRTSIYDSQA